MIEYLQGCEAQAVQNHPVCIIGSGAAGISLAISLSRQGHRVLLVEGGDWNEQPELTDAYEGEASPPHPSIAEYRRQRFGGTTHLWGGRCVPLDPLDFARREHVANSGWPVSHDDIDKHLQSAMDYCDAGAADFSVAALAGGPRPLFEELPSLSQTLHERIERYSLPTDFGKKFRLELKRSRTVRVVLRARCTLLGVSDGGAHVEFARLTDGQASIDVRADHFILCGGGIEIPRLLMCTRLQVPAWSRFDQSLGRYYACHFDLIFGAVSFGAHRPLFDFQKTRDGVYARRKLHFNEAFQAKNQLLNSAFRLHFPPYSDASHGSGVMSTIFLAKATLPSEYQSILDHGAGTSAVNSIKSAHLRNIATDLGSVMHFGADWLFKRKLARRKLPYTLVSNRNGTYPLEFNSEQVPDDGNRIELLDTTDRFGMRRASIHWRLTSTDIESARQSFLHLQRLLNSTRDSRLRFNAGELAEAAASALPVGGHHIGATRMGTSCKTSVVDRDCRVHGVDNLFVAGASVFSTSSHANPTLSIVAIALRLADHLASGLLQRQADQEHSKV